jgi:hypothetical protein
MALTKPTFSMIEGAYFNALDYGAVGDGSTDSASAIQAAIDDMSAGDTLIVPAQSSYYIVDASNTSEAIQVNKSINIIIDGEIRSTSSTSQANPATIFYVTADNVMFGGSGKLRGPGTYSYTVTPTDEYASLIYVFDANNTTIKNLHFVNAPQAGIYVASSNFLTVTDCTFTGGPTFATITGQHNHANIYSYSGGNNWLISNNVFEYDTATNGSAVQHILNSTNTVPESWVVSGNSFFSPHEHCTYLYLNNSVIADNVFRYTNLAVEQQGSALKMGGDYNTITGNAIFNCDNGGIDVVSPRFTVISNNTIENCGGVGISVANNTAILHALDGNVISSNYIDGNGSLFQGIRYSFDTTHGTDNGAVGGKILSNTIINYGSATASRAAIAVFRAGAGSSVMEDFIIADNTIKDCPANNGIYSTSAENLTIKGNIFKNNTGANFRAIRTDDVNNANIFNNSAIDTQGSPKMDLFLTSGTDTNIHLYDNYFSSSAAGAAPFSFNSLKNIWGSGNRLSDSDNTSGVFTMNGVASLTVNNGNILDASTTSGYSVVLVIPLNAAAATAMGGVKSLYVSAKVAKTSFTVATADGNVLPSSDHIFAYQIL